MTAYDMIILGLGPAGAYLGHRATARGLRVLGIDPVTTWSATYGGWVDELVDVPLAHRCYPSVRFGGLGYRLDREYGIVDSKAWREQLLDFEVLRATGDVLSANHVTAGGQEYMADVVVDARGLAPTPPLQQALGWFLDDGPQTWMDFGTDSFLYSFPTRNGHLVEETYLAIDEPVAWEVLEDKLRKRFPDTEVRGVERVSISLAGHDSPGPALGYGARAGFVNPISGFSLGTSISMAEPTLDALWGEGKLPWRTPRFKLDRALAMRLQLVLLKLEPLQLQELLRALLLSPFHARFLTLGDLGGTLAGMAWVFARVSLGTKMAILKALTTQKSPDL
ncbi:lycopene cyclase family protein [Corynebacterium sp. H130]|uniref:lycopene cyclase family protein n=1 Tax=Corynebacterium sp. H130 TaxID=3133444 RepID=UPI0030B7A27A